MNKNKKKNRDKKVAGSVVISRVALSCEGMTEEEVARETDLVYQALRAALYRATTQPGKALALASMMAGIGIVVAEVIATVNRATNEDTADKILALLNEWIREYSKNPSHEISTSLN